MTLTPAERRQFRRFERGLRVTDPDWTARHGMAHRGYAVPVRCSAAALALALVVAGTMTGVMPVVFCGILLASGALTSYVGSRSRTRRTWGS